MMVLSFSAEGLCLLLFEEQLLEETGVSYTEGDRRYVTHLLAERNMKAVSIVKSKHNSAAIFVGCSFRAVRR